MSKVDDDASLAKIVRTVQIIIAALIIGQFPLMGNLLFVITRPANGPQPVLKPSGLRSYTAIALAAFGLIGSIGAPQAVVTAERRKIANGTWKSSRWMKQQTAPPSDTQKLILIYLLQLSIGVSMHVGPATFALDLYMREQNPLMLGLSMVLIFGLALRFPTTRGVQRWLEDQMQRIDQDREFAGTGF